MAKKKSIIPNSKQQSERRDRSHRVMATIALMTSKLLGENTYAKSSINAERLARGEQRFLKRPIVSGMSLADFQLAKQSQLGYLVAVKDLQSVALDQVQAMVLWATGANNDEVINRAAGNAFSVYLAQSNDRHQFVRGYQTAIIQFVEAIAGDQGVLAKIRHEFQTLTFEEKTALANNWFKHVNQFMTGTSPYRTITDGASGSTDAQIAKGIFAEVDEGYLMKQPIRENQAPLLGNYVYTGDDFSDQHHLPEATAAALNHLSLSETINLFVNGKLAAVLDLLCSMGLYEFVYRYFRTDNQDLISLPPLISIDLSTIISTVDKKLPAILERLEFSKTLAELAASLPIINLSNAGTARNAQKQNFQQRLSAVMDRHHQQFVNDRGEWVPIDYGFLAGVTAAIRNACCLPLLVQYTVTRNQLFSQIKSGDYAQSRRVGAPDFNVTTPIVQFVDQLARYQVDQLMVIVKRGRDDYEGLNQVSSQSAFNHLMRVAPQMRKVNPNYVTMSKPTKRLYYWLYQSSFADTLERKDQVSL